MGLLELAVEEEHWEAGKCVYANKDHVHWRDVRFTHGKHYYHHVCQICKQTVRWARCLRAQKCAIVHWNFDCFATEVKNNRARKNCIKFYSAFSYIFKYEYDLLNLYILIYKYDCTSRYLLYCFRITKIKNILSIFLLKHWANKWASNSLIDPYPAFINSNNDQSNENYPYKHILVNRIL